MNKRSRRRNKQTPDQALSDTHPKMLLPKASRNLIQFASSSSTVRRVLTDFNILNGQLIPVKKSLFRKTFELLKALFSKRSRADLRNHQQSIQKTVLQAIDLIKKNHLFIEKWRSGSTSEKELASMTMEAIRHYNAFIQKKSEKSYLARYFHRSSLYPGHPIELPEESALTNFQAKSPSFNATALNSDAILTQELDAIRMKARVLLSQQEDLFPSSNLVQTVQKAPISASIDPQSMTSKLCLTVQVLPGMTINVHGTFKRNPEKPNSASPLLNSFSLTKTKPSGSFPYPIQYNGWALCEAFIPHFPQSLDQLPLLQPLYKKKQEFAKALSVNSSLINHAQEIIQSKIAAFNITTLNLHTQLSQAIVQAASNFFPLSMKPEVCTDYFEYLRQQENPYEHLSNTYQEINHAFVMRPYVALQQTWIEHYSEFAKKGAKKRLELAVSILEREKEASQEALGKDLNFIHTSIREYILLFGEIFGKASQNIILQNLSETMDFQPPKLNEFEKKLMIAAFYQLQGFMEELSSSDSINIHKYLERDIALFLDLENQPSPLIDELDAYYCGSTK